MKYTILMLVIGVFGQPAFAGSSEGADSSALASLVAQAVNADPSVAGPAIGALRSRGADGLAALLDANRDSLDVVRNGGPAPANWEVLRTAVDRVAGQRDAYASRLFWHTGLDAAIAEARAKGKPVLSLRLLGRLDEEMSCANSRFFRTVLYANAAVSARMANGFVLHWSTERPVPRITIDYGDGRTIETTITGNSAHYVLDTNGRVVDVIPGLYGPDAFLRELDIAGLQAARVGTFSNGEWRDAQMAYWQSRAVAAESEWNALADRAGMLPASLEPESAVARPAARTGPTPRRSHVASRPASAPGPQDNQAAPTATEAAVRVVGKRAIERPIVREIDLAPLPDVTAAFDRTVRAIVPFVYQECRLDSGGVALMARKAGADTDFATLRLNFERSVTEDTILNRYRIHPMILGVLMTNPDASFEAINRVVYDQVFQTPASDPWLGLKPDGVYTALEPASH